MNKNMASGYLRLNGRFFTEGKLKINMHKLSQVERVSYPTVLRYVSPIGDSERKNDEVKNFSGEALYAILVSGMGYTEEEAKNLRVGDIFEFVKTGFKNGQVSEAA